MLDELDHLSDRNIRANKLFQSLQSAQSDFPAEHFNTALLYFVADLMRHPLRSRNNSLRQIFAARADASAIKARMVQLIHQCSAGLVNREGLVEALDAQFITRLMSTLPSTDTGIVHREDFALHLFDIMLRRTLAEDYRVNLDHSHVMSSLVVSLATAKTGIIETFPYSGAIGITARALNAEIDSCYWEHFGYPYAHQDLIKLRHMLRNLEQDALTDERFEEDCSDYLTLVDGAQSLNHNQFAVFTTLRGLIDEDLLSDLTIIIVDETHSSDLPDELRDYIARHDLLEAVIDLPSLDIDGRRTAVTAWLLNKNKKNIRETLCINATHLATYGYFEPTFFVAAVIERWRAPFLKVSSKTYKPVLTSNLKGLFLKFFADDYVDFSGLCKSRVSSDVLDISELTARRHVGEQIREGQPDTLDSRELLSVLFDGDATVSCSYIIGNNGAGKSLLLRELIADVDEKKLDSVGIAFGSVDRFPLELQQGSFFNYQGARGTGNARQRQELLRSLSASLVEIYNDHNSLKAFTRALKLINFNHQHYLVPIADESNPASTWEFWLAVIGLHEDMQPLADDARFEPGIQRGTEGTVVRFSELSSGEQQVLFLLIKICSKASNHTVFLIDEPEISLHVLWQQQLPALLSLMAKEFACSFVVATHAPVIVANVRDDISHCFLAKDQQLIPIAAHQRHSVESILLDGFKTYTPDSREIHERCAVLVSRAIRVINQPGRIDTAQEEELLKPLRIMKKTMSKSVSEKHDARYKQDFQLIIQSMAAIKQLFGGKPTGAKR